MIRRKKDMSQGKKQTAKLTEEVLGILLIAAGIILAIFIYFSYEAPFADFIQVVSFGLFGILGYVIPALVLVSGVTFIAYAGKAKNNGKRLLIVLETLLLLSLIEVCTRRVNGVDAVGYFGYIQQCFETGSGITGGGALGALLAYPMERLLGAAGAIVLFSALVLSGAMLITHFSIQDAAKKLGDALKESRDAFVEEKKGKQQGERRSIKESAKHVEKAYMQSFSSSEGEEPYAGETDGEEAPSAEDGTEEKTDLYVEKVQAADTKHAGLSLLNDTYGAFPPAADKQGEVDMGIFGEHTQIPAKPAAAGNVSMPQNVRINSVLLPKESSYEQKETPKKEYQLPYHMDLLSLPKHTGQSRGDINKRKNMAAILEQTLRNFNIEAEVINIVRGPVVTRYELQPAPGVKVSRIVALSDDIALNLAASSIRIEAPIPGKAAIGIEIPNAHTSLVAIREMIDTPEFKNIESKLAFAVGKDITGRNVYGDLASMPHLLIAGTTGAGKSVCVNALIISILYKASPDEVVFMMMDPKVVEMRKFNGIPHMKTDVVTDPKKAPNMLNWAAKEMLTRYKIFADAGVKNIDGYNVERKEAGEKIMPKVVIIVDELADLMMAGSHEVEDAICRIAQLGRASGIHLVIATQSPRVDVITGLIKANIPSRIAFTVSSSIDSRTILDMGGAEKLLGKGDMLYLPVGQSKPVRLQGCYISDEENERVIEFLKNNGADSKFDETLAKEIDFPISPSGETGEGSFDDELMPQAVKLALEYEQISTSMLQRRLRVGYARAARIVDELEQKEIVTPADGNKPRQILITWDDYRRMFGTEDVTDEWR